MIKTLLIEKKQEFSKEILTSSFRQQCINAKSRYVFFPNRLADDNRIEERNYVCKLIVNIRVVSESFIHKKFKIEVCGEYVKNEYTISTENLLSLSDKFKQTSFELNFTEFESLKTLFENNLLRVLREEKQEEIKKAEESAFSFINRELKWN